MSNYTHLFIKKSDLKKLWADEIIDLLYHFDCSWSYVRDTFNLDELDQDYYTSKDILKIFALSKPRLKKETLSRLVDIFSKANIVIVDDYHLDKFKSECKQSEWFNLFESFYVWWDDIIGESNVKV